MYHEATINLCSLGKYISSINLEMIILLWLYVYKLDLNHPFLTLYNITHNMKVAL